jgi:hypothetical protein
VLTPATTAAAPDFLPTDTLIGLVVVGDTWAALSIPSDWGRQVLDVVGDKSGPVFDEPARLHLVWLLPPGGAADWPDAKATRVIRYGRGDRLLVPGAGGYHDGTRWLRSPLEPPLFTDPDVLRAAIEFVIGPLEEAAVLGPVVVCQFCRAPTRDGHLTDEFMSPSGPLYRSYACPRCWSITAAGGEGRHLRAVHRGPR